jgi:hypothetical protein
LLRVVRLTRTNLTAGTRPRAVSDAKSDQCYTLHVASSADEADASTSSGAPKLSRFWTGHTQLVAFDETGEVRTLYPTGSDHFFAGPGAAVSDEVRGTGG